MNRQERMKVLVELLNKASKAYYQDAEEIMSNYEYEMCIRDRHKKEAYLPIHLQRPESVPYTSAHRNNPRQAL